MPATDALYRVLQDQATLDQTRATTQDTQALAQWRMGQLIQQQQDYAQNQIIANALRQKYKQGLTNPTGPGSAVPAAAGTQPEQQPSKASLFGLDFAADDPLIESLRNAREGVDLAKQRVDMLASTAVGAGGVKAWQQAVQDHDNQQKEYRLAVMDTVKDAERRNREAAQVFGQVETPQDLKSALQYVNDNVSRTQAVKIAAQIARTIPDIDKATPEEIQAAVAPITGRFTTMGEQLRFRGTMENVNQRDLDRKERARIADEKAAAAKTGATLDPEDAKAVGAQIATGVPLSQAVPGYGKWAQPQRDAARKEAIQQIKDEEGITDDADAGRVLAQRQIDYVAGRRSTTQLNTMLGATNQAVRQLDFNIDKAAAEMKKLPSTDLSPVLNSLVRGAERWTGDPAYSSLFYYMHAAAMESARILQGGQASIAQLHQGAAEEAKKWADIGITPAMWDQVSKAMHDEGAARIEQYKAALQDQKVGKTKAEKAAGSAVAGTAGVAAPASPAPAPKSQSGGNAPPAGTTETKYLNNVPVYKVNGVWTNSQTGEVWKGGKWQK